MATVYFVLLPVIWLGAIDAAEFALRHYPREWIVEGISVAREPGSDSQMLVKATMLLCTYACGFSNE